MTDFELGEFLISIKIEMEKGCWETNYFKNVNSKGQPILRYKNKMILLYRLAHLLFNSNISNLATIFHTCNNLSCFNPAHLTDDLKEKQFKEKMPGRELLEGCSTEKNKKKILIDYGNWLSKELGRPLVNSDFEVEGRITFPTIRKYFEGSMANYFNSCDFLPVQRKMNMTDSEMKEFLKDIKIVTKKGCWETDYWKTSHPDGRISIGYKRKFRLLYRVCYTLFKGDIPDGLEATHTCDNSRCYNPDHIIPDTHEGNMDGNAKRGRLVGNTGKNRKSHKITNPYDYKALLNFVNQHIKITEKNEWIFGDGPSQKYPKIKIKNKTYRLPRLILANNLGKKYDEIDGLACHRLPDGSKPDKRDVNPDHLFEGTRSKNALDTAEYHKGYKLDMDKANQVKNASAKFDFSERGSKNRFDKEWAAKLNVSKNCIGTIRSGKSWNNSRGYH